jgi:hypothetical protein
VVGKEVAWNGLPAFVHTCASVGMCTCTSMYFHAHWCLYVNIHMCVPMLFECTYIHGSLWTWIYLHVCTPWTSMPKCICLCVCAHWRQLSLLSDVISPELYGQCSVILDGLGQRQADLPCSSREWFDQLEIRLMLNY